MADTKETTVAEAKEAPQTEFIEYSGEAGISSHFLSSHTIPKGDSLWKRNGLKVTKDVTWERSPDGPAVGFGPGLFRVPVADLDPEAVAVLEKTPGYKRVSE